MHDAPLTRHPETGSPVRRIIVGGIGLIGANTGRSVADAPAKTERKQADGSHCCGGGCGCHN
jgi:predicted nucleic acid-binding Zn ribbon protein